MGKKILCVDDAAFMRMMIKDALTKNGYTNILEAADGEAAWYKVELNHHNIGWVAADAVEVI